MELLIKDSSGNTVEIPQIVDHRGRTIELAKKAVDQREIGVGGVSYFHGFIDSDEFNKELTGSAGILNYDKMVRTDSQIAAILNAIDLNLLSASYNIEAPKSDEEAAKVTPEIIDFVRDNLFVRINFEEFLRHALTSIWAGFSWFEKVLVLEDGQIQLKKLASRLASTLYRWETDGNGELTGVIQRAQKDSRTQDIPITREKIALFVFQKEGNNYEGRSILRPVWRHFLIKDAMYKIDAIRHERFAIGVPVITIPDMYDQNAMNMAKAIGKNWRGAEQSYVVMFPNWNIEIMQVKGAEALDIIPTIQHHNEEIAKSTLAQFINFGTTQTGSRALGDSAQEFFIDAMEGMAKWVCSVIQDEIIWPLVDLNYPNEPRPEMVCADLGTVSLNELTRALRVVGDMYITPDDKLEDHLRRRLDLPPRDGESASESEEEVEATAYPVETRQILGKCSDATDRILEGEDVSTVLEGVYNFGRESVQSELSRQGEILKGKLHEKTIVQRQARILYMSAPSTIRQLMDALGELYEGEEKDLDAEELVQTALTLGRDFEAQRLSKNIKKVVYRVGSVDNLTTMDDNFYNVYLKQAFRGRRLLIYLK